MRTGCTPVQTEVTLREDIRCNITNIVRPSGTDPAHLTRIQDTPWHRPPGRPHPPAAGRPTGMAPRPAPTGWKIMAMTGSSAWGRWTASGRISTTMP
ncbi:hypothetical protein SXCC_01814 [Gluconacetobacter sp. SXCC-1]|nr:hypothetical protein SXCC_01814 [Gluconacetobacter sp. SXCC-1]